MFNGENWKPIYIKIKHYKRRYKRRRKMDKRTYLEHLEAEYRSLTSREIEIASRKATLHAQIEKIKDELALERINQPKETETKQEQAQEFIKKLSKRWKK